jgi:hypothetical protein
MAMPWEEHNMSREQWDRLSPSDRVALYREKHPAPVKWAPREPTAEQQAELDAISDPGRKLTRFREMEAQQGQR